MSNMLDALKNAGLGDAKKMKKIQREMKDKEHQNLKNNVVAEAPKLAPVKIPQKTEDKLTPIYEKGRVTDWSGRKRFYFVGGDNEIASVQLSDLASIFLDRGKYAIVRNLENDDYELMLRASAAELAKIDEKRVLFMKKQEA